MFEKGGHQVKHNLIGMGLLAATFLVGIFLVQVPATYAGGKIQIDDTKWVDFGMGIRSSYTGTEDGAANGSSQGNNFGLDNFRLYMNGQIHEYIKFEFNTETTPFSINGTENDTDMFVLDAIAKFEFNQYINIWAGRMLAASDRAEMSGPFFASTYTFNKTPFYPQDFGNFNAGKFGRDDGVNLWGALGAEKRFTYVAGLFDGLDGPANSSDSMLFAGRVSYNFLNVEKNPGYYTSSTYYGEAGDIFTVAYALQNQANGAGSLGSPGDFTGMSWDLLYETKLANNGVVTVEGEVKHFEANYDKVACGSADGDFCIFDGDSYLAKGLYMFPQKIGIGQFQPYVVYTGVSPDQGNDQFEFEGGLNYIIDGHRAKAALFYQYGDIDRFDFSGLDNRNQYTIGLALQFQLL